MDTKWIASAPDLLEMTVRVFRNASCRAVLTTVFLALALTILGAPRLARATELVNQTLDIAIQGYDPVAYFTDGRAVKGSDEFAYKWLGATWYFASAEHRDLFMADPVKYAPQYGGYCAKSVMGGGIGKADAKNWRVVDGKLYLYGSPGAMTVWDKDATKNTEQADANWQLLKANLTQ